MLELGLTPSEAEQRISSIVNHANMVIRSGLIAGGLIVYSMYNNVLFHAYNARMRRCVGGHVA